LGGLLAGGAAGSVLSGGLNDLLKQFQQSGHSDTASSWVGLDPTKRYRRMTWPAPSERKRSTR
jgi:uncharacterized protein YidB (DUF937 family)